MPVFSTIAFYGSVLAAEIGLTAAGVGAVAGAVSAGATGYNIYQQNKMRGQQMEAEQRRLQAQQRIASIKERRARTKQIAEERRMRAQNINRATVVGGGASGSSGIAGATGSLRTKLSSNLSFMEQIGQEQTNIANEDMNIFGIQSRAATTSSILSSVSNISGTIFDVAGGYKTMAKAIQ